MWANFPWKYAGWYWLKENNYHVSIIRDRAFSTSRAVLEGKCKNLREHEKGNWSNKSNSLLESEVNILWECGQLRIHSPMPLINTICGCLLYSLG